MSQRERQGCRESICSSALFHSSKERCVYLSVSAQLIQMKGTVSVSVSVCGQRSHCHSSCMFVHEAHSMFVSICEHHWHKQSTTVPGFELKHRHTESPERPRDISETHLHYLIFSQEMAADFLQLCTKTKASGCKWDGKEHLDNR